MKFYNLLTSVRQREINQIIASMSALETQFLLDFYRKVSLVEYTDESGFECMFILLNPQLIKDLGNLYTQHGIKFTLLDLTEDVVFDNPFKTKYRNSLGQPCHRKVLNLIRDYKKDWTGVDDVLDKILVKGIESLTPLDYKILRS